MKVHYLILIFFISQAAISRAQSKFELKGEYKYDMYSLVDGPNLIFKFMTCPLIKNSGYEYIDQLEAELFSPPVDITHYFYDFDITPWPKEKPFYHYYILKRKGDKMRTPYGGTIIPNIPCSKYYPFDDQFLVKYDTITGEKYRVSGNFFLDKMTRISPYGSPFITALESAELRTAQYNVKLPISYDQKNHTKEYFEFYSNGSSLSKSKLLIRVMNNKNIHRIGQKWEMIYYSNSKEIPGNIRKEIYEVKYTRTAQPVSTDELFPKYRRLNLEEVLEAYRKYFRFIEFEDGKLPQIGLLYSDKWEDAYNAEEEEEEEEENISEENKN